MKSFIKKKTIIFIIVWLLCGFAGTYSLTTLPKIDNRVITNGGALVLISLGPITLASTAVIVTIWLAVEFKGTWMDQPFLNHPNNQRVKNE